MKRKLISLLILAMLLLSLFPCAAFAEEPAEAPAEEPAETPAEEPEEEAAEPERRWPVKADDLICFGVYNDTPVTWVVLDPDQTNMGTEGVFLLTQGLWDSTHVVFDESSTLWEGSLGQEWCTKFAESAFSQTESALVPYTDKHEDAVHLYALTWREVDLKQEQVFFLSVVELEQYFGSYGPENKYTVKPCSLENYWWLRSPHYYHNDYHGIVLQSNMIHDYLPYARWAARPCINLSLQDALFLLPAEDAGAPGTVTLPGDEGTHQWKLLAQLPEHPFRAETEAVKDGTLTLRYSGADTDEKAMLSLLVRDGEGRPVSLRRLERPAAEEGSLSLELAALELPEGGSLELFCEQLNGPRMTDYASPPQVLETALPEPEPEPAPEEPAAAESPAEPEPAAEAERPAGELPVPAPAEPEKPAQTPSRPANSFLRSLDRTNLLITVGAAVALLALLVLVTVRTRSLAPALLVLLLLLLALLLGARRYGSLNPLDWFGLLSLRL